jgi:FkbM family methyltransferase
MILSVPVALWLDLARKTRAGYEKEVRRVLLGIRGDRFVDVGAHLGTYSFLARANFGSVLCFEPGPEYARMIQTIAKLRRINNVSVSAFALSDADGTAWLRQSGVRDIRASPTKQSGILVRTARIDTIVNDVVDCMKIDVEGGEWRVLRGAEAAMRDGRIINLVIEVHREIWKKQMEKYLEDRQYSTTWIDSDHLLAVKKRPEQGVVARIFVEHS